MFQNEFTCAPEALFKDGKPYHSVKSKLLQFIDFPSTPEDQERYYLASMRGLVVDLSVVIDAKGAFANRKDSCFDDFAKRLIRGIAKLGKAGNADRIDIVADLYDPLSIKGPTRKDRGIGPRLVFDDDAKLPTDFSLFFKNDKNKGDLNMLIAKHITNPDSWDWGKEVLVTYRKKVLALSDGIQEIYQWQEDVHEEA